MTLIPDVPPLPPPPPFVGGRIVQESESEEDEVDFEGKIRRFGA
jgi:hypothetical protein